MSTTDVVNAILGPSTSITKSDVSQSDSTQKGTVQDTGTSTQDVKSTSQTGTVTAGTSDTQTSSASRTQSLSDEQIKSLTGVLDTLSKNFSLTDLSALGDKVGASSDNLLSGAIFGLNRAVQGDAALSATINPILDAAKQQNDQSIAAIVNKTAGAAGTTFNSLVTKAGADAATQGNVNLAALGAQLVQQNRKQVTDEITGALGSLANATSVLASAGVAVPIAAANVDATNAASAANIANVLKGAITDSTANQTTAAQTRNESQQTTNTASQTIGSTKDTKNIDVNTLTSTIGSNTQIDKTSILDLIKAISNV